MVLRCQKRYQEKVTNVNMRQGYTPGNWWLSTIFPFERYLWKDSLPSLLSTSVSPQSHWMSSIITNLLYINIYISRSFSIFLILFGDMVIDTNMYASYCNVEIPYRKLMIYLSIPSKCVTGVFQTSDLYTFWHFYHRTK